MAFETIVDGLTMTAAQLADLYMKLQDLVFESWANYIAVHFAIAAALFYLREKAPYDPEERSGLTAPGGFVIGTVYTISAYFMAGWFMRLYSLRHQVEAAIAGDGSSKCANIEDLTGWFAETPICWDYAQVRMTAAVLGLITAVLILFLVDYYFGFLGRWRDRVTADDKNGP